MARNKLYSVDVYVNGVLEIFTFVSANSKDKAEKFAIDKIRNFYINCMLGGCESINADAMTFTAKAKRL